MNFVPPGEPHPYLIDPRFPLYQQGLPGAKASHRALAELLGDPALVRTRDPLPMDFDHDRLTLIASHWATFNTEYTKLPSEKTFDKYERRLNEEIPRSSERQPPEAILPPYFAADGVDDAWWRPSKTLFELTAAAAGDVPCYRVVCAKHSGGLDELLEDVGAGERLVVWVSGLDEPKATTGDLATYRRAIEQARSRGQQVFALYGGFFSVLLGAVGLRGSAHGVGFSEHRVWRELPESGAPPARYYVRRAHRYVPPDLAQQLYEQDPTITECGCPHCGGRPPNQLAYHDLMKHSVWCRAEEISHYYGQPPATAAELLRSEHAALVQQLEKTRLPPGIRSRAFASVEHLPTWAAAMTLVQS